MKTNLPAEPNAFVGRERDAADLGRLLESMRAVTLCGAGGIGKTRLALHVAHAVLDAPAADGADDGGVWFVELADVRPDVTTEPVARRVAAALDVAEEDGRPLTETLAGALRAPAVLLVLDNCEHVVEECAKLTGLLLARCPRLRILATSREPLRMAGENVWRVPPLEPDEAVRLFLERARAARPGFAPSGAVYEVTRALDGMPLAVELAAARVRVLSADQIARRLADRFRLLSAGDRTAPARQRTLRAAIDWSHELLDRPERVLLRRLSVFSGWTLEQAEHVCAGPAPPGGAALPADDVLDTLTALVDKSLVTVTGETGGEVRFRLLDSIREYAAERLADAGEEAVFRGRHRDAVLAAAERDGRVALGVEPAPWADRVALFHRYDTELGNVRAALTWSLDHGDIAEGLRLCTALRAFWIARGRVAEWADRTDRFLSAGRDLDPRVLGPALAGRAQLAVGGRDFAHAARRAGEALALCREAGDDFMTATALITGAECLARAGRFADAAARLDEADALVRGPGREWTRAYACAARGYLLIRESRLREARERLDTAASVMREIGHLWGASHAMIGLGRLAELRGDPDLARGNYAAVLPILAEIGARPELARALAGLGRVALAQGDLPSARASLARSLALSRSSGIRLDVARALDAFAELVACEGDARGAVTLAGAASALREATGREPGTGARRERVLEPIRRRIGEPLVAQYWGEGRAMPADDAVARALRGPGTVPPPRRPVPGGAAEAVPAPVTPPSTLTAREREIARLVSRGLSNRGIADELVISPATAARHVTNILTKLGFSSRAQIAAWAVDNVPAEGS
ncbi:ATP-binding protein [Actinomadura luteofluorescens]|uniref:ATP-binding protein n=1 Tax=Actinomadura luteofluorescens TaxID=46163 RepID=UPI0030D54E8A